MMLGNGFSLGLFLFMSADEEKVMIMDPSGQSFWLKQSWLVLVFSTPTEMLKLHDSFDMSCMA